MDFGSFLARAEAVMKPFAAQGLAFSNTHVFNLGNDEKVEEGVADVWEDLKDDMKNGVPMPFKDTSCVSLVPNVRNPFDPTKLVTATTGSAWIFDRVIDVPLNKLDWDQLKDIVIPPQATTAMREAVDRGPVQKLLVMRVEEHMPVLMSWFCYFYGVIEDSLMLTAIPTMHMGMVLGNGAKDPKMGVFYMEESRPIIKQVAVISHPGNYIVNVKPRLTPKEERRVAAGKTFPTQKMPHFVVVDHDVLVAMSGRGSGESHASPVPHHRRGHWMRLAERCREARASGKDRVWVRPTYVGDTKFSDLKNDYSVLMDFNRKAELAIV